MVKFVLFTMVIGITEQPFLWINSDVMLLRSVVQILLLAVRWLLLSEVLFMIRKEAIWKVRKLFLSQMVLWCQWDCMSQNYCLPVV